MMRNWSVSVVLALAACGAHETKLERGAAAGNPVAVDVEEAPDGSLRAARVAVSTEAEEDDDGDEAIPLEDLPQVVVDAMNERWPGATWLAAEKEGSTWGVEFVTVDGEHLEAEFDADGAMIEMENADHDDDAASAARAFVVGTPTIDARLFGVHVQSATALPAGPIRAVGRYAGDHTLACETAGAAPEGIRSVGGISQGLVPSGDGWTLTVLDLDIAIDTNTPVTVVDDPLEDGGGAE